MSADNKVDRRAKSILNRLVAGRELSEQGRDWLIAALDPFHDTEVELDGYPDIVSSRSITQCVQKSISVTKPPGVIGDWDCHLFFLPAAELKNDTFRKQKLDSNAKVTLDTAGFQNLYGGLNVIGTEPGTPWDNGTHLTTELRIPKAYSSFKHRLIGVAYEVRNVTAPLYKQGAVVCYKQPMQWSTGRATEGAAPQIWAPARYTELPPKLSSNAALYPNSRIWDAAEGCYNIITLNDVENDVSSPTPMVAEFTDQNFMNTFIGRQAFGSMPTDELATCFYPFDNVGAVFTGLSSSTSLLVTVRYLYERFPTEDSPDLLVLARPPSPYDPLALELYARCLRELPSFVMVKENPLGEWFGKVLETVSSIAPILGKVVPLPGAALIGDVVGKGAGAVASALRPSPAASQSSPPQPNPGGKPKKKNKKRKN